MPHVEQNDALKDKNKIALQRYEFAIVCLRSPEVKEVLDLGCGMGYGTQMIDRNHNVIGIDSCQKAIDYANNNYPGNYRVEDLENGQLFEADAVVCLEVLCHLKDPQGFIDRIKSRELIISSPIDPDPNDGYFYRLHNLSEKQFKEMLKDWKILSEFRQKKYLTVYAKK